MKLKQVEGLVSEENKKRLFGKKVECVREARPPAAPTVIMWEGETEDGYFRAAMIGGVVMMHWAERWYQIKYNLMDGCYIGGTKYSLDLLQKTKSDVIFSAAIDKVETLNQIAQDTKDTRFEDVMSLIKWKFKNKKIKVETDDFR